MVPGASDGDGKNEDHDNDETQSLEPLGGSTCTRLIDPPHAQILCHEAAEATHFLAGKLARSALGKVAEFEGTDGSPDQPQHLDAASCKHSAYLPVAAFIEHDLEPAVLLTGPQDLDTPRLEQFAAFGDTRFETVQKRLVGHHIDLNMIGLLDMRFGGGDSRSPCGIVGEEQQPLAGLVQSAHRRELFLGIRQQGIHGLSAFFVIGGSQKGAGFI